MTIPHLDEPGLRELSARRRLTHRRRLVALALALAFVVALAFVTTFDSSVGDPGQLSETLYDWTGPLPAFTDVTAEWGMDGWRNTADSEGSGGVAIGDVDGDGQVDVVVAGGSAVLYLGTGDGFELVAPPLADRAVSTDLADVDGDGALDVLLGREGGSDLILWGDTLLTGDRVTTELDSGDPTTGMIGAELDGDDRMDILRLGYGGGRASPDVVWRQVASRTFEPVELPNSRRRSYAAALADIDGVAGLDIWVTRDVGWRSGGDSLYLRSQSDAGEWVDSAAAYGLDVEVDGMGVTLADFTGDGQLDGYLSDLGDNELLERSTEPLQTGQTVTFSKDIDRGIGRIRSPAAASDTVSSSWASGVADLNLDGYLDLVVVNGGLALSAGNNKIPNATVASSDPPAIFLGLPGEFRRWADVWPLLGLDWNGSGRGLSLADLDGDLDTDIVISTRDAGLRVLRNDAEGAAVALKVEGACDPTGVFVEVETDLFKLRVPMAAPTFLGRHGPEFILGSGGGGFVRSRADGLGQGAPRTFQGSARERLEITCAELARPLLR